MWIINVNGCNIPIPTSSSYIPSKIKYSPLFKVPQLEKRWQNFLPLQEIKIWNASLANALKNQIPVRSLCPTPNYWATDSSLWLVIFTYMHNNSYRYHRHAAIPNTAFKALHFLSFILCTWHVKLLKESEAISGMSRAREKETGQILKL